MSRYLFLLILIGYWAPLKAQNQEECKYVLTGTVIDQHDQSHLAFASIYIIQLGKGSVADENGNYRLENICEGSYQLVVSHVSCSPDTLDILVNRNIKRTLFLEHHHEDLAGITILGQNLQRRANSTNLEYTLGQSEVEQFSSESLGDALRLVPGVSSLKTGHTIVKPVVQGLYGSRIMTVNYGVRMQDMEWGDEHSSTIDINT